MTKYVISQHVMSQGLPCSSCNLHGYSAPSHYLDKCWLIVNWTPRTNVIDIWILHDSKVNQCCSLCRGLIKMTSFQWHHNGRDVVSNHQPRDCLLNSLFWRRSKKTSKLRVTGLCEGNSPGTGEFPAQKVTRKMFPFDDVIMSWYKRCCCFNEASMC